MSTRHRARCARIHGMTDAPTGLLPVIHAPGPPRHAAPRIRWAYRTRTATALACGAWCTCWMTVLSALT